MTKIGWYGTLTLVAAWLFAGAAPLSVHAGEQADRERAMTLFGTFTGELLGQLQAALREGGPTLAIEVCSEKAPAIAAKLSRESGAYVRRVSLKTRNPQHMPDAWEQQMLLDFDAQAASGANLAGLATTAYVDEPAGRSFRFLKAIPTQAFCLACHGESLDPAVEAVLRSRYPYDVARGYRVGMVRGAFSVKMKAN